jgi:hypothetical protein
MKNLLLATIAMASFAFTDNVYAQIPQHEREALIALYYSTNGAAWNSNDGWLSGPGTECTWYKVSCRDGHVFALDLRENNLDGIIPASLGDLSHLKLLYLFRNSLRGKIPPELGNLQAVERFYLFENAMSGSIPSELGNLKSVKNLYLFDNQLTGPIPPKITEIESLERVALSDNSLSGAIPEGFMQLQFFKGLSLKNNNFSGPIPRWLGDITNLDSLDLEGNQFTGEIPTELGKLINLKFLSVANNQLSGNIPLELSLLVNLEWLDLSNNWLYGPTPQWLIDMSILDLKVDGAFNSRPSISINGGDKEVEDTDRQDGETVNLTAIASDSDGTINKTLWFIDSKQVASGLTASIFLPNGQTTVTFEATDNTGESTSSYVIVNVQKPNSLPMISINTELPNNNSFADLDGIAGETISLSAIASDIDGTVTSIVWLVDGSEVQIGDTAALRLPNGRSVITAKATDNKDESSETSISILVQAPEYKPIENWPFAYNGTSTPLELGLELNNIGLYEDSTGEIASCLKIYSDGFLSSLNGASYFDVNFQLVDIKDGLIKVSRAREFNSIGALTEENELPDCSGVFDTASGIYRDILEMRLEITFFGYKIEEIRYFEVGFIMSDPESLTLRLTYFDEINSDKD